jgi:L-ascorbate metabolism protein UlaG (beta-lactamase superfamily)
MRALCLLVGFTVIASAAEAQSRPKPDVVPGNGGEIVISPIAHGTLHLSFGPTSILVDPTTYGGWDGAPTGAMLNYDGLAAPTLILVTDIHGDHFDPDAIAKLKTSDTKIGVPNLTSWQWPAGVTLIANGTTRNIGATSVEAVPMYNLVRGPNATARFHDKGRGNGYVVTLGGKRIYISGDTECTPEMKALKNIDVAFIAMNLPYTATPAEAAECAKAFKPRIAYPYHYKGQDLKVFESALAGSGVEVRIRDWYSAVKPSK